MLVDCLLDFCSSTCCTVQRWYLKQQTLSSLHSSANAWTQERDRRLLFPALSCWNEFGRDGVVSEVWNVRTQPNSPPPRRCSASRSQPSLPLLFQNDAYCLLSQPWKEVSFSLTPGVCSLSVCVYTQTCLQAKDSTIFQVEINWFFSFSSAG